LGRTREVNTTSSRLAYFLAWRARQWHDPCYPWGCGAGPWPL